MLAARSPGTEGVHAALRQEVGGRPGPGWAGRLCTRLSGRRNLFGRVTRIGGVFPGCLFVHRIL